jgi:hypothetical protein
MDRDQEFAENPGGLEPGAVNTDKDGKAFYVPKLEDYFPASSDQRTDTVA